MALLVTGTVCVLLLGTSGTFFWIAIMRDGGEIPASLTFLIGTLFGFVSTFLGISSPGPADSGTGDDTQRDIRLNERGEASFWIITGMLAILVAFFYLVGTLAAAPPLDTPATLPPTC